jgi:hypothetical protein
LVGGDLMALWSLRGALSNLNFPLKLAAALDRPDARPCRPRSCAFQNVQVLLQQTEAPDCAPDPKNPVLTTNRSSSHDNCVGVHRSHARNVREQASDRASKKSGKKCKSVKSNWLSFSKVKLKENVKVDGEKSKFSLSGLFSSSSFL